MHSMSTSALAHGAEVEIWAFQALVAGTENVLVAAVAHDARVGNPFVLRCDWLNFLADENTKNGVIDKAKCIYELLVGRKCDQIAIRI